MPKLQGWPERRLRPPASHRRIRNCSACPTLKSALQGIQVLNTLRNTRDFLAYLRLRSLVRSDWHSRHRKVLSLNPNYCRPAPRNVERDHLRFWQRFDPFINLNTLRICNAISGHADPHIVPEEVFATDISRCLNNIQWAPLLSHKSMYHRVFDAEIFPRCLFHRIAGHFYDSAGGLVCETHIRATLDHLHYPIVLKPNTGSSGGDGVIFAASQKEVLDYASSSTDFVAQELLKQHPFFASFNPHGLNTIRVYTYRSVTNGAIHILNSALRMGRGGSLDNETNGGIVSSISDDGNVNSFAVDKYGVRYSVHPDTGIRFDSTLIVPQFAKLRNVVVDLASRLPMMTVAGWDMSLDEAKQWRCIEVNLSGHTIRFSQYAGQPFFRNHTEEVVSYCLRHRLRRKMVIRAY